MGAALSHTAPPSQASLVERLGSPPTSPGTSSSFIPTSAPICSPHRHPHPPPSHRELMDTPSPSLPEGADPPAPPPNHNWHVHVNSSPPGWAGAPHAQPTLLQLLQPHRGAPRCWGGLGTARTHRGQKDKGVSVGQAGSTPSTAAGQRGKD